MKRRVILILLLLVAGAIVNVAVAWACAANGQRMRALAWPSVSYSNNIRSSLDFADRVWLQRAGWQQRTEGYCTYPAVAIERPGRFGFVRGGFAEDRVPRSNHDGFACEGFWALSVFAEQIRTGWPSTAMLGGWLTSSNKPVASLEISGARLPTQPLWPGFAINTVFYAGVLWLLFTAPFALQRRRRIRCGLCPKCDYDLRGGRAVTNICPECGASK